MCALKAVGPPSHLLTPRPQKERAAMLIAREARHSDPLIATGQPTGTDRCRDV